MPSFAAYYSLMIEARTKEEEEIIEVKAEQSFIHSPASLFSFFGGGISKVKKQLKLSDVA